MRDALLAALCLNYFNLRCSRIRMANIAQTVNVLQAMILTDGEKMILTPTYHVFTMMKVHQDATLLPLEMETPGYTFGDEQLPALSASASLDNDGKIHISIANIDASDNIEVDIDIRGRDVSQMTGTILTADQLNSHNTFEKPREVTPSALSGSNIRQNMLRLEVPAKSVLVLEMD
jgi:alpha-N-arabinofuranosidase